MAEHQTAFENIKQLVLGANCLTIINYKDKELNIYVTTDANDCHTGAVLSFGKTWESACPVAYNSYQLNNMEKNYEVFTLPLVFRTDPRRMAQIPLIPGHQFFGVFGFTIPHGMMRNLDPFHADPWNLLGLFRAH